MNGIRRARALPGFALTAALLMGTAVTGCDVEPKTVSSSDAAVRVTVPGRWNVASDLNDDADIQASDRRGSLIVIVIREPKDEVDEGTTLERFSQATRRAIESGWDEYEESGGPTELQVGGHPAIRYELKGKDDGSDGFAIHTVFVDDGAFYQVLAVADASKWPKAKAELIQISDSVRGPGG